MRHRLWGILASMFLGAAAGGMLPARPGPATPAARVWEAPLDLPAYQIGPPDPNPCFPIWSARRPVYPYPLLDHLGAQRGSRTFSAVYLENEYLRVTVMPELGGKIYSIFDKAAKREVLYTNRVVKYGLVGIRGAWTSGGIEWNFPDGHTVTAVSLVDYVLRPEPDGSAVVVVGDTERIQRMQWAVAIRLRPGVKAVETEVTLNNRTLSPGRYWYWATAAAPATDDLRFVYPMREAYPHQFWPVFAFPRHKQVDIGTYREVPHALSLFAKGSRRDFFGVYYEKSDWGIAHIADYRELAGKKTWTWGTDPSGRIWTEKLTDTDGQYVEFQAGRFETQMEHEFIGPHRVERFVEHWFPLAGLGGAFDEVTRDAALRLETGERRAVLRLNVSRRLEDAQLIVERGGDTLYARRLTLSPAETFSARIDLDLRGKGKPILVRLLAGDGGLVLSYRSDLPADGNADFKPARRSAPDPPVEGSTEQAYRAGLSADKKSRETDARAAYRRALEHDAGFSPALAALGWSFYRCGEYEEAERQLAAALRRDPDSPETLYCMGLVQRALGRRSQAAEHMIRVIRAGRQEAAARYVLAEMALEEGRFEEGRAELLHCIEQDPRDIKARALLALAERLSGRIDEARARIEAVGAGMPIDYFALHELAQAHRAPGGGAEKAKAAWDELWRLLSREPDGVLELVLDYAAAGRYEDCVSILEEAGKRYAKARRDLPPMLRYTLGYFLARRGDQGGATEQFRLGSLADPAYSFPHRPEEIRILRAVLSANPRDGRAAFLLGNALAALYRPAEALDAWRAAVSLDGANAVLWRNLGLALWRHAGEIEDAIRAYSHAIELEPLEHHRYLEMDALLASKGRTRERIRLLEGAPAAARGRPGMVEALAAAFVDGGRFAEALDLLRNTRIFTREGERGALETYRRARRGLARLYREQKKHEQAAVELIRATEYPTNLGVGRTSTESHARELVLAAQEFEKAGNKDAAEALWQRAASEPLGFPTLPREPWSEHYYYKALALQHSGRVQESQAIFERLAILGDDGRMAALEPTPPSGALRFLLAGLGLKRLGRESMARIALQKALELDPANELARAALGRKP